MKLTFRTVLLLLILLMLISCKTIDNSNSSAAGSNSSKEPVPYSKNEFPGWLRDLRRAEIIMIGALPLSYMITGLIYDNYMNSQYSTEGTNPNYDTDYHVRQKAMIAASAAGTISLTDFLLGLGKNKNDK